MLRFPKDRSKNESGEGKQISGWQVQYGIAIVLAGETRNEGLVGSLLPPESLRLLVSRAPPFIEN